MNVANGKPWRTRIIAMACAAQTNGQNGDQERRPAIQTWNVEKGRFGGS